MLTGLLSAALYLLNILGVIIFVQVVLSWLIAFNVINTYNDFVRAIVTALDRLTAPFYRPIRKILPDFGGLDFSPLVVLVIIQALRIVIENVLVSGMY